MKLRKPYWPLLRHRECLIPTWRGMFLIMFLGTAFMLIAITNVHSFLAVTEIVPARVLVVEGWLPDYALEEAMGEFQRHPYQKLYVTGGPLEIGGRLSEYKTYAELGAATLVHMGMNKSLVEAVPSLYVRQDRTYASAVALKKRLLQHASLRNGINLVSLGVHARRSQMLFQKAFGEDYRVGIIAIQNHAYDSKRWWKFSAGVRTVVGEFIAYIYALVVFPFESLVDQITWGP
jgi:hypothetical protein